MDQKVFNCLISRSFIRLAPKFISFYGRSIVFVRFIDHYCFLYCLSRWKQSFMLYTHILVSLPKSFIPLDSMLFRKSQCSNSKILLNLLPSYRLLAPHKFYYKHVWRAGDSPLGLQTSALLFKGISVIHRGFYGYGRQRPHLRTTHTHNNHNLCKKYL